MELLQIFSKVVSVSWQSSHSEHTHGQGPGLAGGARRVYVFTAKSGWELARIIVYNMTV